MKFSEFEIEVLQILWRLGEGTTPDVHREIAKSRKVAYTTVRTIIDRLVRKNAIKATNYKGRAIAYTPIVAQAQISGRAVESMVERMFEGKSMSLVSHLLEHETLTAEDITYLESVLERKKKEVE